MSISYTAQGPFTTGGTATAANLTAMDAGITTATNQINTDITAIGGKVDGTHGFYNGFKLYVAHALPTSGMAKGDVCVLTPFS